MYYQRPLNESELSHCLAYLAIASYYCFIWALFQESQGNPVGSYLYLWRTNVLLYAKKALQSMANS